MSRVGSKRESLTPRFCNPCIGFSKAPEHVEGGFLHERRGGSTQLIAYDCLKYYLFNLKKYKERKYIAGIQKTILWIESS
jgi:hypothetical protein